MKKKHKKKIFMVPRGSLIISFQTTFHCYIEEEKKKNSNPTPDTFILLHRLSFILTYCKIKY